jgi:hypothetical protein
MITNKLLSEAMSYEEYKLLLESLLAEGKTTGTNQSEAYINYAKINLQRMKRLEKTTMLNESLIGILSQLKKNYILLIITEGWCGDASQNLPVFHLLEKSSKHIQLKLILRDEHLDVMENYLTHGARAIPIIICLDEHTLKELFVWGPRPQELQEMVVKMKKENKTPEEKGLITQNWYNSDKTETVQSEILNLLQTLS